MVPRILKLYVIWKGDFSYAILYICKSMSTLSKMKWNIPAVERLQLSMSLFWDVPQDRANINRIIDTNPDWLVERVFEYGKMKEVRLVIEWYGEDVVKEVLCQAESLSKICLAFAAVLFDLEKEAFKCYRYKRSHPIYY